MSNESGERAEIKAVTCPNCGAPLKVNVETCPFCAVGITRIKTQEKSTPALKAVTSGPESENDLSVTQTVMNFVEKWHDELLAAGFTASGSALLVNSMVGLSGGNTESAVFSGIAGGLHVAAALLLVKDKK